METFELSKQKILRERIARRKATIKRVWTIVYGAVLGGLLGVLGCLGLYPTADLVDVSLAVVTLAFVGSVIAIIESESQRQVQGVGK